MASNAIYIDDTRNISVRSDLPIHQPEDGELLIEVSYSGVNPADIKATKVLDITSTVIGNDFCGRVLQAPAGLGYEVDDIVAGYTFTNSPRPLRYGTHQRHIATSPSSGIFKVPGNMPHPDAAALMSSFQTACDAVFNRLELPVPDASAEPRPLPITMVIWGGSTTLGVCSIQLARAIGVSTIIVTASSSRHQLLKDLGATHCIDYKDADVVAQVNRAVLEAGHADVRGFEAVGFAEPYRAFLDALSGVPGTVRMSFSWIHSAERPGTELAVGGRHYDVSLKLLGGGTIFNKGRPEEAKKIWQGVEWAVANYGTSFKLPSVRVFEGTAEEAVGELETVAALGAFGKVVLKQPLK